VPAGFDLCVSYLTTSSIVDTLARFLATCGGINAAVLLAGVGAFGTDVCAVAVRVVVVVVVDDERNADGKSGISLLSAA
jgi:hypothetical protein